MSFSTSSFDVSQAEITPLEAVGEFGVFEAKQVKRASGSEAGVVVWAGVKRRRLDDESQRAHI